METLDVDDQPPSMLFCVLNEELLNGRPLSDQLMRAGGLEGAVRQVNWTTSPTLASVAPDIVTSLGATLCRKTKRNNYISMGPLHAIVLLGMLTQNS